MVKIVLALVLLAHGIGHSMGLLQLFRVATINPQWHGDSWLLTGSFGTTVAQVVGAICWTIAIVGFIAAGDRIRCGVDRGPRAVSHGVSTGEQHRSARRRRRRARGCPRRSVVARAAGALTVGAREVNVTSSSHSAERQEIGARRTAMERVVDAMASGLGNGIGWLADHYVLFGVFLLLWAAFGLALVASQGSLDEAWSMMRSWPLIVQLVSVRLPPRV